jgi:hypothetical protein
MGTYQRDPGPKIDVVIFTSEGEVKTRFALAGNGPSLIEICGGEWHSVVFHAPAAVALEVKPGPGICQMGSYGRRPHSNSILNLARKSSAR